MTIVHLAVVDSEGAVAPEEELHRFVRERRERIASGSRFLGDTPRLPSRVGKRVTQEELAEHLGVSRQWYARFEGGAPAGFSAQLLNRLCNLLLLSAPERAQLVGLAMPELVDLIRKDVEERGAQERAKPADRRALVSA
jgi:DNA-binding XRE family transcriptional regulator